MFDVEDLSGPSEPSVQHCCASCGKLSPAADEGHTLVSAHFGWRLLRQQEPVTGVIRIGWRCPACWREFSSQRARA